MIRATVAGVHGSVVATSDGFLLTHDVTGLEPTEIAALVATTRALASRTTLSTGRGQFREVVARGSDGYLAVYAAGHGAIVAVIGTSELNVAMLHYRARAAIERIAELSAQFTGPGAAARAEPAGIGGAGEPARARRGAAEPGQDQAAPPLPTRRPLPIRRR